MYLRVEVTVNLWNVRLQSALEMTWELRDSCHLCQLMCSICRTCTIAAQCLLAGERRDF